MITKYKGKHYKKKYIIDISINPNVKQVLCKPLNKAVLLIDKFDNFYDNITWENSKKQIQWLIKQIDDNYYTIIERYKRWRLLSELGL